jgi:Mn2+/Fe2+ NRAMP family transporter
VPDIPFTRDAVLVAVATVGTTLAPWGLVFIQSYAADKHLELKDLRYENVDVLPVMRSLASDTAVMGEQALDRRGQIVTGIFLALIAASVLTLAVLTVAGWPTWLRPAPCGMLVRGSRTLPETRSLAWGADGSIASRP